MRHVFGLVASVPGIAGGQLPQQRRHSERSRRRLLDMEYKIQENYPGIYFPLPKSGDNCQFCQVTIYYSSLRGRIALFRSKKFYLLRNFRFHPNLILGGTYSGQIVLWDNRVHKRTPIQRTPLCSAAHTVIKLNLFSIKLYTTVG